MTQTDKTEIQNMINEAIKPFNEMMKNLSELFKKTEGFTLPFDISIPNETTLKAMQDADSGTNCVSFDNDKDMLDYLHAQCIKE